MNRTLITAAASRAVSVADFKVHARIDETAEDTLLGTLLDAAEEAAENFLWRKIVTQTWDQYFDGFCDPLCLAFGPVASVTSVSYVDENGTTQTLASSVYELGSKYDVPVVRRKYNQVWPATRAHEDVVIVRFVVGYTTIPDRITQAICVHAATQYRDRENFETPEAFYRLLRPLRLQRFMAVGHA